MTTQMWTQRLAVLAVLLLATASAASALTPGEEFHVNTETASSQRDPLVASSANGGFVVVWESLFQDDPGVGQIGIYGQAFDPAGEPDGTEFLVNAYTTSNQRFPALAMHDDGTFVVTWTDEGQSLGFARAFDAAAAPVTGEVTVSTSIVEFRDTRAAALANGNFVLVFTSENGRDGNNAGIFARLLDDTADPIGTEDFLVNTYTTGRQEDPDVAALADGFVVVWQADAQDGSQTGIFAQRMEVDGTPAGTEFQVNTYTTGAQVRARADSLGDGGFVVVWDSPGRDGDDRAVVGRRFDADGDPAGTEFLINTYTTGTQSSPDVARITGGFVVAWSSFISYSEDDQDGSASGVFGRQFDAAGDPVGAEFAVNAYTTGPQSKPVVTALGDGFVVAWESTEHSDVEDDAGIFARIFEVTGSTTTTFAVTTSSVPLTTTTLGATTTTIDGTTTTLDGVTTTTVAGTTTTLDGLTTTTADGATTTLDGVTTTTVGGTTTTVDGLTTTTVGGTTTTVDGVTTTTVGGTTTTVDGVTTTIAPTTSTTVPGGAACGDPVALTSEVHDGLDRVITASDALFVLRAAVGSETCAACICDVGGDGSVTASDALLVLRVAVGSSGELSCPPCDDARASGP